MKKPTDLDNESALAAIREAVGEYDSAPEAPAMGAASHDAEVEAALAVLDGIVDRARADIGVLHDKPILAALYILQQYSSRHYESLIAKLRGIKNMRLRPLEAKIKGVGSNLHEIRPGESDVKTLADYFPNGSPLPDLEIPNGYWYTNDGTYLFRPQQSPETVAHGAIAVTGRTEDIDGGSYGVRLSWCRGRQWSHRLIDRTVMAEARMLTALAGYDFPVNSGNAKYQVKFLADLESQNYHRLPVKKTATRFGWMGDKGKECFLIGNQFINSDGEISITSIDERAEQWDTDGVVFRGNSIGENQIAEGYQPTGNYGDWVNAVFTASAYPVVMATIYASLTAPMLSILGCKNFIFSIDGDTSYGKTSAAGAGASVWGNPDISSPGAAMVTWGTTLYAIERRAAALRGLPVVLDDTKLAPKVRGEQEIIPKVIYMVASGRAAAKGQPNGLRSETLLETVMITTGEMPAVNFSLDGGTRNRVIEIEAAPFGGKSDKIEKVVNHLNRQFAANYGHAGPRFVQYLIKNRDQWARWRDEYRAKTEAYIAKAADLGITSGRAGRLAAYVAAIAQTAEIAHKALELPYRFYQPLDGLWADIAAQSNDPLSAEQAFKDVMSWCDQNKGRFIGWENDKAPAGGWAGKWHPGSDEIFIYPPIVEDLLRHKGFPAATPILKQWRDSGCMRCGKDQLRYTVQIHIVRGGSTERVYALKRPSEPETQLDDE